MALNTEAELRRFLESLIGDPVVFDTDTQFFIELVAFLLHPYRNAIQNFPNLRDIDGVSDEFLQYLWQEYAAGLPANTAVPQREFIREAKNWYSSKGTSGLFSYIGDLTGTLIQTERPGELIFTLDDPATVLDGGVPDVNGFVPYVSKSRLGRIRDGIRWAFYTYVLDVNQAQVLLNIEDFLGILDLVHPAGTARFPRIRFNYFVESHIPKQVVFLQEIGSRGAFPAGYAAGFISLGLTDSIINPFRMAPDCGLGVYVVTRAGPEDLNAGMPIVANYPRYELRGATDSPVVQNHIDTWLSISACAYDDIADIDYDNLDQAYWVRNNIEKLSSGIMPLFHGLAMTHENK